MADRCSGGEGGCVGEGTPAPQTPTPTLARSGGADGGRGAKVVAAARKWIGTPYRHQASCRGVGADCLGLVRGVWREVLGAEPERPPAYTPDWAEATGDERLMRAAARHLLPVAAPGQGDVLLFRMRATGPAKHVAILSSGGLAGGRLIHAWSGHAVCETRLTEPWARRLVGVFRFPGV